VRVYQLGPGAHESKDRVYVMFPCVSGKKILSYISYEKNPGLPETSCTMASAGNNTPGHLNRFHCPVFVLHISKAPSYLSDKPEACTNCHIMAPQYATWSHSSHREWTHCNDCHVPHNNVVNKYYFKANDGLRHATIFTLRNEPQVIQIRHAGIGVVQDNCLRCHDKISHGFK